MPSNIPGGSRLVLGGSVTMQSVEAVHAQLLQMIDQPVVEIDCDDLTEADLSLVQVILAARASARKAGRTIVLAHPATNVLRELLQRGGFLGANNGSSNPDNDFWLQTVSV